MVVHSVHPAIATSKEIKTNMVKMNESLNAHSNPLCYTIHPCCVIQILHLQSAIQVPLLVLHKVSTNSISVTAVQ